MTTSSNLLRITEIFHSLQGESTFSGLPTVFIRLTGCPLRCEYCDTAYAFNGGTRMSTDDILKEIAPYHCQYICVTGGEPLAQPGCLPFLSLLSDAGYTVSIETSGAFDVSKIDPRVTIIMDIKTPGSKEAQKNKLSNLEHLKPSDQVKFVICNEEDYQWSCQLVAEQPLLKQTQILFSPSWGELEPTKLANWIIKDQINVRFQLQLHKILWNDQPGH